MHDFEYSLGFRECGFREEFLDNKSFSNFSEISATDRGFAVLIIIIIILYFVLYRNNQIYKKGQSQRLKWLGQHNNNRGLLKEQTGLTNLQN